MSEKIKIGRYELQCKSTDMVLRRLGRLLDQFYSIWEKHNPEKGTDNSDILEQMSMEISALKWVLYCPAGNDDDELYIEYYRSRK